MGSRQRIGTTTIRSSRSSSGYQSSAPDLSCGERSTTFTVSRTAPLMDLFLRTRKEIELAENVLTATSPECSRPFERRVGTTWASNLSTDLPHFLNHVPRRLDACVVSTPSGHPRCLFLLLGEPGFNIGYGCPICPTIVRPWLGWLLGETEQAILARNEFDNLVGVACIVVRCFRSLESTAIPAGRCSIVLPQAPDHIRSISCRCATFSLVCAPANRTLLSGTRLERANSRNHPCLQGTRGRCGRPRDAPAAPRSCEKDPRDDDRHRRRSTQKDVSIM